MNAINISINGFRLKHDVTVLPRFEVNYLSITLSLLLKPQLIAQKSD